MASFGKNHREFLEAATHPQPYRGHPAPAPIREKDAALARKYLDEMIANRGTKPYTAKVLAQYLAMLGRVSPPFTTMTTEALRETVSRARETLSQNTQRRYFPVVKSFARWLVRNGHNKHLNLKKIAEIKAPGLDRTRLTAAMMLTAEEITKLLEAAKGGRDKAAIATMFEGALRPSELLALEWDDLHHDRYGIALTVAGKTGKPRPIRLIFASPYLNAWKAAFPIAIKKGTKVFSGLRGNHTPLTPSGLKIMVRETAKRAGIKKSVFPYLMRHSRVTAMIQDGVPESAVKMMCWGSLSSNMLANYAHLSHADVDRVFLTRAGLLNDEAPHENGIRPRQCGRCGEICAPTAGYCSVCGLALTQEAAGDLASLEALIANLSPAELVRLLIKKDPALASEVLAKK